MCQPYLVSIFLHCVCRVHDAIVKESSHSKAGQESKSSPSFDGETLYSFNTDDTIPHNNGDCAYIKLQEVQAQQRGGYDLAVSAGSMAKMDSFRPLFTGLH